MIVNASWCVLSLVAFAHAAATGSLAPAALGFAIAFLCVRDIVREPETRPEQRAINCAGPMSFACERSVAATSYDEAARAAHVQGWLFTGDGPVCGACKLEWVTLKAARHRFGPWFDTKAGDLIPVAEGQRANIRCPCGAEFGIAGSKPTP